MKFKKGVTVQTAIISLVLLVAIASILLLAEKRLATGLIESADKEVCKVSVLARAGMLDKNIFSQVVLGVPELKCKTEYSCLELGNSCPKNYEITKVKNQEEINKQLAGKMVDCWYQLAEGKVDFVGSDFNKENVCVICSEITFDESAKNEIKTINDFHEYISKTKVPNTNITYWKYLRNNDEVSIVGSTSTIDLSKKYVIIYSRATKSWWETALGGGVGGALVYGSIFGSSVGPLGTIGGATAAGIGVIGGAWSTEEIREWINSGDKKEIINSIILTEYNADNIAKACQIRMNIP